MSKRIWHSGPPPHIGWWNASVMEAPGIWRWWDGGWWSLPYNRHAADWEIQRAGQHLNASTGGIEWTDYYPKGARVSRVDPRSDK